MACSLPLAFYTFFYVGLFALPLVLAHPAATPEVAKTNSTTKDLGHRPGHTIEHNGITHRVCGTEKAGGRIVDAHKDLHALHKRKPNHRVMPRGHLVHEGDLWDVVEKEKRANRGNHVEGRKATTGSGIVVETYVHFVASTDQKDAYSQDDVASMVAEQVWSLRLLLLTIVTLLLHGCLDI